ncbi:hypothetical protein DICPUDRAFT_158366 [Dictyostelium purpureum]|uniref:Cathepsin propeptide inhibitor domain-containing protein n=1 Tax=Dictyostelium purpureum TaxID=5786 RepID=F1A1F9_DICPU|nr:uncharacterized protein DICPUDRAFT_158366 [Dictyostelium purpureum]EGC29972.1 hypothetical protein DICPUDRAFT_158366 [Dictyostelium purpureum]|eukprot:XP_003293511.1 hypothetical protein DICPUDRAFT_158366 [Dictyostelium purpureum]
MFKLFKVLLLLTFIIFNSVSSFEPSPNEIKYWTIFKNWCDTFGKTYDESTIEQSFNNFKDNYNSIVKENSLNQAPFVTVSYSDSNKNENNNINRKLFFIEAAQVEIQLPINNQFQVQSLNQFSDLSHGEFISYYTGLEDSKEESSPTGNGLSKGEISGITIGSVFGGLGFIALCAFIGRKIFKLKKEEKRVAKGEQEIKKVFGGVNINLEDLKPGRHQSITGRAIPIDK